MYSLPAAGLIDRDHPLICLGNGRGLLVFTTREYDFAGGIGDKKRLLL